MWCSDGLAADFSAPCPLGPAAAALGPVEAQVRGSLPPHILTWLVQASLPTLLELLLRDRDFARHRVSLWMKELVAAAVATQEPVVTELPRAVQSGRNPSKIEVSPLPLDPTERAKTRADGKPEMATAAECGLEEGEADKSLYFYDPARKEGDVWRPAVHAQLPPRDTSGEL